MKHKDAVPSGMASLFIFEGKGFRPGIMKEEKKGCTREERQMDNRMVPVENGCRRVVK